MITVNVGTGSGTLGINLGVVDSVHDEAGNALSGVGKSTANPDASPLYTIDKVQPSASIAAASGQTNPATTSPVTLTVTFSKPVIGLTNSSISLTGSTVSGAEMQR